MPLLGHAPHSFEAEAFELATDGTVPTTRSFPHRRQCNQSKPKYPDGTSIDWLHEESEERTRNHSLRLQHGIRGLLLPMIEAWRMWLVVIATGIGIGLAGAWLDVLVKWLGDLREGRCSYGFFYNQVACCRGLDPGGVCDEWETWSDVFAIRHGFVQSLLQSFVYIALAIAFAGAAAVLVENYAPYAFHTGIPEIKAILGGYVFDAFLTPWTLLIKALGLALAVASGLSLGKEGPLVHVSCCMAHILSKPFEQFRRSEAQKRRLLAAAAAAGVSVAFGSPLGGVLFGLEELDTFSKETDVMWRGFVASAVAAVALQWVNPFETSKLVLFQVASNITDTWRAFELIPWIILGVIGGALGSLLIKLNVEIAVYRKNSILSGFPVLEVIGIAAITAATSYLIAFARVPSSELVANLFQACDTTKHDYHGLCNPNALWYNVFLLILTAGTKIVFTAWTFGMMIPAGIFMPTIAIGACLGRAMGILTQSLYRSYPTAWIFLSCPPDPSVPCISPGFYAVIGASAMLGGVTRMTISLVVILFELTGALSHVLPIMIVVMTSKWVGDALGTDGIYAVWIAMRQYPWLSTGNYQDHGETAASIMIPREKLVVIEDKISSILDLKNLVDNFDFNGFPVVHGEEFLGYITREKLGQIIEPYLSEPSDHHRKCTFSVRALQSERAHQRGNDGDDNTENLPGKGALFSILTPSNSELDLLRAVAHMTTTNTSSTSLGPGNGVSSPTNRVVDFSRTLDHTVLQLRKEVSQELVVTMFQKMNLRQVLFSHQGKLLGMATKGDISILLTRHFEHAGTLAAKDSQTW